MFGHINVRSYRLGESIWPETIASACDAFAALRQPSV